MTATEICNLLLREIFPVAALLGFVTGTGFALFAWMVRQPYRLFRDISGAGVGR